MVHDGTIADHHTATYAVRDHSITGGPQGIQNEILSYSVSFPHNYQLFPTFGPWWSVLHFCALAW